MNDTFEQILLFKIKTNAEIHLYFKVMKKDELLILCLLENSFLVNLDKIHL